jgi:hypothetical protein
MQTIGMVFVAMVAGACSSSNSGPAPGQSGGTANADNWCAAYCAADEKCSSKVDDTTCENTCHNSLAALGPHVRADYVQGFTSCIPTDDCADVTNAVNPGKKCSDQALASIAATSTAQSYCQQAHDKATSCSQPANDVATCENAIKAIDDASLQNAIDCLSKACDQWETCVVSSIGVK